MVRPLDGFYVRIDGSINAWCKACYREWYRSRYTPRTDGTHDPRNCLQCGVEYKPKQKRPSIFCSYACKDRARKDSQIAARLAAKPERGCLHCGQPMPKSMRIDAAFCSEDCNTAAHHVTGKMAKRAKQIRPREDGLVKRSEIAERDRWRCQLCGGRVARWRKHPDPLAASIDHRLPVARGGGNDEANLQLVHLRCNLRKRAG